MPSKAVILAAGAGTRLASIGWDKPKCLLPCPGGTLLDRALSVLADQGVTQTIIVVGFRQELVREAAERHAPLIRFVENAAFAATNTIHSLWLAREHLTDGAFCLNADVWFDVEVIRLLKESPATALAVDTTSHDAEAVKVVADADRRITRIGKDLSAESSFGEFVGVAKFDRPFCAALVASLRRFVENHGRRELFFESAIDAILRECPATAVPLGRLRAIEIDTPDDLTRARNIWRDERRP